LILLCHPGLRPGVHSQHASLCQWVPDHLRDDTGNFCHVLRALPPAHLIPSGPGNNPTVVFLQHSLCRCVKPNPRGVSGSPSPGCDQNHRTIDIGHLDNFGFKPAQRAPSGMHVAISLIKDRRPGRLFFRASGCTLTGTGGGVRGFVPSIRGKGGDRGKSGERVQGPWPACTVPESARKGSRSVWECLGGSPMTCPGRSREKCFHKQEEKKS